MGPFDLGVARGRGKGYRVRDAALYGRTDPDLRPGGPRPRTPVEREGPRAFGSWSGARQREPDHPGVDARQGFGYRYPRNGAP